MRRYFCTGATGFVGREIVRQLLQREDTEEIICLSRKTWAEAPMRLGAPKVSYWHGDILDCVFPGVGGYHFTDLIHGANEVNDTMQPDLPHYYMTIVEGTNRVMKWAATTGIKRTLLLSSGGVARDTVYGRAKRMAEMIVNHYGLGESKIARIFATVGPECPLDGQYAAGIFIGQALRDKEVRFWGGTSVRTYIDVTDCARWLLKILDDEPHIAPVDVAGDEPILIRDLAYLVGRVFDVPVTKVDGPDRSDSYIPDLSMAALLGLKQTMTLTQSLERIRDHYKAISAIRNPVVSTGA